LLGKQLSKRVLSPRCAPSGCFQLQSYPETVICLSPTQSSAAFAREALLNVGWCMVKQRAWHLSRMPIDKSSMTTVTYIFCSLSVSSKQHGVGLKGSRRAASRSDRPPGPRPSGVVRAGGAGRPRSASERPALSSRKTWWFEFSRRRLWGGPDWGRNKMRSLWARVGYRVATVILVGSRFRQGGSGSSCEERPRVRDLRWVSVLRSRLERADQKRSARSSSLFWRATSP
jgi:hypothetical protein